MPPTLYPYIYIHLVWHDSRFNNIVTVEFLFYYDIPESEITGPYQQTIAFANVLDYELWAETTIATLASSPHRAVSRALEAAATKGRMSAAVEGAAALEAVRHAAEPFFAASDVLSCRGLAVAPTIDTSVIPAGAVRLA